LENRRHGGKKEKTHRFERPKVEFKGPGKKTGGAWKKRLMGFEVSTDPGPRVGLKGRKLFAGQKKAGFLIRPFRRVGSKAS